MILCKSVVTLIFVTLMTFTFVNNSLASEQDMSVDKLIRQSSKGNREAQYILGAKYYSGNGVKQDYDYAIKLFSKAAIQGHPGAQFNLGYIYEEGMGLPHDYMKASVWYKAASDGNYPGARKSFVRLSIYMSKETLEKVNYLASQIESSNSELYQNSLTDSQDKAGIKAWLSGIKPAAGK